ncbi:hypothetical protein [Croceimicrobium hydrocarbonivorans]|uniref:YD repeat-containing protein n=1 Tax=Croceimicrobium hydrocarbonivorans TaxID=2761580 RepID=A0A7H0VET3_9FLAO|nr:hypothetical protein [Croceimicrobium hydrocarbonivorans]QNR24231.1 hypothetical protein H4K34_17965 [Croceimicrobium hydrocarbonivorans]
MKKKTPLFLIMLLSSSLLSAQSMPYLLQHLEYQAPDWDQHLQLQINAAKDTVICSSGRNIEPGLIQEDHYDLSGNWIGVDRILKEGDAALRRYNYNNSELLVLFNEQKQIQNLNRISSEASAVHRSYEWQDSLILRVNENRENKILEWVFIYSPDFNRLNKVKHYENGQEAAEFRFSYNSAGQLLKEEHWAEGSLQRLVSYQYEEGRLHALILTDLVKIENNVQEKHFYQYQDDGWYTKEVQWVNLDNNQLQKRQLSSFNAQGQLLENKKIYYSPEGSHQNIDLYSYPESDSESWLNLSLRIDRR